MKIYLRSITFSIFVTAWTILMTVSVTCQTNVPKEKKEAVKAWENLIKAKGGCARLHGIETVLFTLLSNDEPAMVRLHVPPTKVWYFLYDMVGIPMAYRSDSSIPLQEWANPDGSGDSIKTDASTRYSVERVLYLLETRYEKPTPERITRQRVGKVTYDVLETSFGDQRIDFYFDPEELLVSRVVRFNKSVNLRRTYVFSDYTEVGGIKMPQWEGDEKHDKIYGLRFAFNVDYDPAIFTGPLKVSTIDGWKRRSQ